MKTRINNITLLTINQNNDVFENASIVFDHTGILDINGTTEADEVIDGKGYICMPGMINTHAHFSMIPFRSLQDDCPDRLRKFLLPLERSAMNETLAVSAVKLSIAESLLAGVTTVFDMYYFPDAIAQCYSDMKMRAVVAETIINEPSCDSDEPHGGLKIAKNFIEKWQNHSLVTPAIAPHAPNTNSIEALKEANFISQQYHVPISMHVSEMDYEMKYFNDEFNMTPIAFLESIGVLSDRFIAAHAIHAQESDFAILQKYNVKVAHCIGSNTKAAKGIAPVKEFLQHGIAVGLGSDGPSSGNTLDLFTQMNLFAKFHKFKNKDRAIFPAAEILRIATMGGAKVLRMENTIGSLEVGKKADIVLVETDSVNMFPIFDAFSALVYSANASNVHSVWVDGLSVVKNKQLVHFDVNQLKQDCQQQMSFFSEEAKRLSDELKKGNY